MFERYISIVFFSLALSTGLCLTTQKPRLELRSLNTNKDSKCWVDYVCGLIDLLATLELNQLQLDDLWNAAHGNNVPIVSGHLAREFFSHGFADERGFLIEEIKIVLQALMTKEDEFVFISNEYEFSDTDNDK
ncbi:MAG: hypothetical protein H6679_02820 [Epsilonproteobacteria bacterium]|nr:hypothetical protein [Campylobacterota bacterium]